ncbi:MAG: hypothetical protein RBS72_04010 [Sedimentisphaerales bacterium]|jgi:hypothetical protein|nr:hypothetical protein [Sedimentisphaerales bacterium]NLZ07261.1 hypothetical protein [Phycisphaerae bacterium]HNY78307.1 hypothetical protein [Sedimentisphaerales bacterium]HOC61854.1 hypothetical protein [Sedimentisphaerales bacterium]HOH64292.1 hypothetical protein [Sedimentisphaerales bacterium]
MHTKWMACSAVLVLLAGSGAFGITIQNQVFNVGSANTIDLTQGIQSASSAQNLTIDLSQVGNGSGLSMANVSLHSVSGQMGALFGTPSLLGTSGLLGTPSLLGSGLIGLNPIVGTGGLTMPLGALGSLQMAQLRAQLLGQLLAN